MKVSDIFLKIDYLIASKKVFKKMRQCDICHKKSQIQKSGAHNYGGGWAYRAHKTRWVGAVNLHSQKVIYNNVKKTMRLCTKCLRRVKTQMGKKVLQVPEVAKVEPQIAVPAA